MESCAAQDWAGRLDLVIAAPLEDRPGLVGLLAEWERGSAVFVANPSGQRSSGLNLAVESCAAEFLVRVDARSRLSADHVTRCVRRLRSDQVIGVVGGIQVPEIEPSAGPIARGIGLALANAWMLGGAAYRRIDASGPVDTVYLGAFRRSELISLRYDEHLSANEDFDLCLRYRDRQQQVWLEKGLTVGYRPRETFQGVARQYYAFGRSKVSMWRRSGRGPNSRQILALSAAGLLGAAVVTQVRRPRRIIAGLSAIATVYAVTDAAAVKENSPLTVRCAAVVAHGVCHAAWLAGIVRGLVVNDSS